MKEYLSPQGKRKGGECKGPLKAKVDQGDLDDMMFAPMGPMNWPEYERESKANRRLTRAWEQHERSLMFDFEEKE